MPQPFTLKHERSPDFRSGVADGAVVSIVGDQLGSRRGGGWNWVGVVSGLFNPNDSGVGALERRPRHDKGYHEGGGCRRRGFAFR